MHSTTCTAKSIPRLLSLSQKKRPATGPFDPLCSRLHHWLRLPHGCPYVGNRVLSLYHVSEFSCPMVTKSSKNHKLLCNRVEQSPYTVANGQMHYFACSTGCSCLESQRVVCAFISRKAGFSSTPVLWNLKGIGTGTRLEAEPHLWPPLAPVPCTALSHSRRHLPFQPPRHKRGQNKHSPLGLSSRVALL